MATVSTTDPLDVKVEQIKTEIETIFQNIVASILERKDLLLRQLEERVKQLGNAYTELMDEYSELLRMRQQMEESLSKNLYSDLRVDMLGPLDSRIQKQERIIQSEFKLGFVCPGFEYLMNSIDNFGEISTHTEPPSIPSPPPDIPRVHATPATHLVRNTIDQPGINPSPLEAIKIPRPPPDIPRSFLLGTYVRPSTVAAPPRYRGPLSAPNRGATRPSRSPKIPLPPPDIPRSFLLGTYVRPNRTNPRRSYNSSASSSRLRTFLSLIGNP